MSIPSRKTQVWIRTGRNIVEGAGVRVQERVEEPDRLPTILEDRVVHQSDHARDCRARRARAINVRDLPVDEDLEVLGLGGDVWVRATGGVEQA